MLSGIQEVLVIVVILLAILFIPRMMSPQRRPEKKPFQPMKKIKGLGVRWRLGIFISLLWVMVAAAYFQPWQGQMVLFVVYGLGPIALGWCITWVMAGLGSGRKN